MTTSPNTVSPRGGLIQALHVPGPIPGLADKLMLFGRFVGSWGLEWTGTDPMASPPPRMASCTSAGSSAAESYLDRPRSGPARRGPDAPGLPRLDDPVL